MEAPSLEEQEQDRGLHTKMQHPSWKTDIFKSLNNVSVPTSFSN